MTRAASAPALSIIATMMMAASFVSATQLNSFILRDPVSKLAIDLRGMSFNLNGYRLDFTNTAGFSCNGHNTYACQTPANGGTYWLTSTDAADITVLSATASQFVFTFSGGDGSVCNTLPASTPHANTRSIKVTVRHDTRPGVTELPQIVSARESSTACMYEFVVKTTRPIANVVSYSSFVFTDTTGTEDISVDLSGLYVNPLDVHETIVGKSFDYTVDFRSLDGFLCNGILTYACQKDSPNHWLTSLDPNDIQVVSSKVNKEFVVLLKGGDTSICEDIDGARDDGRAIQLTIKYDKNAPDIPTYVKEEEGNPQCTYNFEFKTSRKIAKAKDDPHFVGLQGEKYKVMGEKEKWFNIITDRDTQVNAFFHQQAYNKAFTTNMQQVGMLIGAHRVFANGTGVYVNEELFTESLHFDELDVVRVADGFTKVATPAYDMFLKHRQTYVKSWQKLGEPFYNVDVALLDKSRRPHGLLGQTAHHQHKASELVKEGKGLQGEGEIEGNWKEYEVSGAYATDFKYNKYVAPAV